MTNHTDGALDQLLGLLSLKTDKRHSTIVDALTKNLHAASHKKQHAEYKRGYTDGKDAGFAEGLRQGIERGHLAEREAEAERVRNAAEVQAREEAERARVRARWLVRETPMGITPQLADEIRAGVGTRLAKGPEPEQWSMILSDDPATYVIAGAGSGKSTTLVLRIVALHVYCGIPLRNIVVFTFTRASREDFIDKLCTRLKEWGITIEEKEARSIVRTFHSMILKIARDTLSPRPRVLELLDRERKGEIPDTDVENMLEFGEVEGTPDDAEPFNDETDDDAENETPQERSHLLRLAYERAWSTSTDFRDVIAAVYRESLRQGRRDIDAQTASNAKKIAQHDRAITGAIEDAWQQRIAPRYWPLDGVRPVADPIQLSAQYAERFYVNGYVPAAGAYIVLGGPERFRDTKASGTPSRVWIRTKRKLLASISDKPLIWIDTPNQLADLRVALTWFVDHEAKRTDAPMFDLIPPGEYKRKNITEACFAHAQFIENLGLPVVDSLQAATTSASAGLSPFDMVFNTAVLLFWPHVEAVLKDERIWTFNQLFAHFSEEHPEHFKSLPIGTLGAMEHLMIDEFQDISPQIVKWIRGCKRELVARGRAGSLMCVGDDWQSIYGWRGSSPDYFLRFTTHFPAPSHTKLKLENNFRSSDHVLRCAESALAGIDGMESKTCRAKGKWADEPTPVLLHEAGKAMPIDAICRLIASEAERTEATDEEPVLVLARSRKGYKEVRAQMEGHPIRCMTFHSAKGLEARSVVLLEDCIYTGTNPLRNFLYGLAELGSYDKAQRAEAHRLAYVGITRAMERCYWFAKKKPGGVFERIPVGRTFARKVDAEGQMLTLPTIKDAAGVRRVRR